jgi:serine/threonine-protein kinase
MATVYWALEHPTNRRVAIKVLRPDLTDGLEAEKRFLREARSIQSINSGRVIRCFEYGIEGHLAYMAMELIDGTTLETFLLYREPDLAEVVAVAAQILQGLTAVHQAELVHRDLKPANIMLCDSGGHDRCKVKLIDFGLARLLDDSAGVKLTRKGDVLGTARYMSPEHRKGSHQVGTQSDIYAFGIILYEILTGQTPFDAPNPLDMMLLHMKEPLPPPKVRASIDRYPATLDRFLKRCLEKDPDKRYQSGGDALAALIATGLPVDAPIDLTRNWTRNGVAIAPPENGVAFCDSDLVLELPDEDSILLQPPPLPA